MAKLDDLIEELVTGNRILAREAWWIHSATSACASRQSAALPLSRSRAPDCIEKDDIMEFTLDGAPVDARGRAPYLERFITARSTRRGRIDVGRAQPQRKRIPFGVTAAKLKPIFHMAPPSAAKCGVGFTRPFRRYRPAGREHGHGRDSPS